MTYYPSPVTYDGNHTHTITYPAQGYTIGTLSDFRQEYPPKEPTMSTIDKIAAERKEAKERLRLEAAFAAWDEIGLNELAVSSILRFTWKPRDKTYTYAAIKADTGWFITGQDSLPKSTDDLIKFMVEKDLTPDDMDWFVDA